MYIVTELTPPSEDALLWIFTYLLTATHNNRINRFKKDPKVNHLANFMTDKLGVSKPAQGLLLVKLSLVLMLIGALTKINGKENTKLTAHNSSLKFFIADLFNSLHSRYR